MADVVARHGRIDILVNNAGIARDQLLLRHEARRLGRGARDEPDGGVRAARRRCCKPMIKQRGGRIISISSVVGQTRQRRAGELRRVEGGPDRLREVGGAEVASRGITVNVVAPGLIETDMTRAITERAQEDWASQIPLGRLGTPDDVASAVCFLASDEASYITGQVLAVNGGMYM